MNRFLITITLCLAVFGSSLSMAAINTLTTEQKLADLDQLVNIVKAGYGPLQYKKEKYDITPEKIRDLYAPRIAATRSNREFYYTILQYIGEFHDGHFRANLPTDLKSSLPFDTDLVEGKVLVDRINRSLLTETQFPFAKGDQILEMNGVDIQTVLDQLQTYRGLGYSLSERRTAALSLTVRDGKRLPVPAGDVTFKIRRGTSSVISEVKLTWKVEGTAIDESDSLVSAKENYDTISTFGLMKEVENPQVERSFRCSGDTRIEIPANATVIMKTPFVAYYYPTEKGNVGYLRIPHYSPENRAYAEYFAQYEFAVSVLEKNTVGLIIDQDHNCGGSVEYLHQIVSLFMSKPFPAMQFQLLANKAEYLMFTEWVNSVPENTLARKNVEKVQKLVREAWMKGDFMTAKIAIDGNDLRSPNDIHYTKPIIVLIDEMSGSGGDAFPAMTKGLGRAKLVGTRTMGLGGHVTAQPALLYSRIVPEMTKSLFYRPDGVPVENNGAVPDFNYSPTRDDFTYGYHDYRAFYTARLFEQL
ncbi:MAG: S41 family peptidase [Bdellovibrionales bacterium]